MVLEDSREISNSVTVTYKGKWNSYSDSVLYVVAVSIHPYHGKHLHTGATKNRQYWHLLYGNKWTDWSNPNEFGIAAVAAGFVSENVAQLLGPSVYRRQKEIKTEPLNRNCLYFNTQWEKEAGACQQTRLIDKVVTGWSSGLSLPYPKPVCNILFPASRGHFRVS